MTSRANAAPIAIYHVERPGRPKEQVIGIEVAVHRFLDAFLRHTRHEHFRCLAHDAAAAEGFAARLRAAGVAPERCEVVRLDDDAPLRGIGTLFCPDPAIAPFAARRGAAVRAYSICGLSHTMSSADVMRVVAAAALAPTQGWDAIICPSAAIRSAIRALWDELGAAGVACPLELPLVPLGVEADRFAAASGPDRRVEQRARFGVPEDAVVVLFVGRLCYHTKAHPLPLLLAAERVARRLAAPLHLVFFGYFRAESFARDFRAAASEFCDSAKVHFVLNDDCRFPETPWAAADIFVSLSDNIQESFGLTPLEAMACGLPVVVSDWDGYRETVRHGVDGFAVPTLAPPPGTGAELARRYAAGEDVYGEYLAGASQSIAVDVDATAQALEVLARDPGLRRRMGEAGRRRAQEMYDWRHVIAAYEDLWEELAARRAAEAERRAAAAPSPIQAPDPFRMFAAFATRHLSEGDRLQLADPSYEALTRLLRHRMNMPVPDLLVAPEELPRLVRVLARDEAGVEVGAAIANWPEAERARVLRSMTWLVKLGYARHRPGRG